MLFLSIHPRYVDAIVDGRKSVELRKRRPNAKTGSSVVIYATTPRCEVVATAVLGAIEVLAPDRLWRTVEPSVAIQRSEFDKYFASADVAVAIHLRDISVLESPIPLIDLRSRWSGFHPPQQFRYLNDTQSKFIATQRSRLVNS